MASLPVFVCKSDCNTRGNTYVDQKTDYSS